MCPRKANGDSIEGVDLELGVGGEGRIRRGKGWGKHACQWDGEGWLDKAQSCGPARVLMEKEQAESGQIG